MNFIIEIRSDNILKET